MRRIGNPDRGQFSRPMQPGQHRRVAPVGLHPIARLLRDQRGSYHRAVMAEPAQQPVKAISAGTCLIAKMQSFAAPAQPLRQPNQKVGAVLDHTVISDLAASPLVGDRNRYRRFVHI